MNRKYKFVSRSTQNKMTYIPKIKNNKFYQICSYKNPETGMYHVRRFELNKNNEFESVGSKYVKQRSLNKFFETHIPAEYVVIPAFDLNEIPYPNMGMVLVAQSELLNNTDDYNGFAKV